MRVYKLQTEAKPSRNRPSILRGTEPTSFPIIVYTFRS